MTLTYTKGTAFGFIGVLPTKNLNLQLTHACSARLWELGWEQSNPYLIQSSYILVVLKTKYVHIGFSRYVYIHLVLESHDLLPVVGLPGLEQALGLQCRLPVMFHVLATGGGYRRQVC